MRRSLPLISVLILLTGAAGAAAKSSTSSGLSRTAVKPSYVYTGKSAQGIAVKLSKQAGARRTFKYRAKMTCNDGTTYLDDYFTDNVVIRSSYFNTAYTSDAGAVSTRVTGKLVGRRATGTIRIVERFSEVATNGTTPLAANGSIICDSKAVKWSATA